MVDGAGMLTTGNSSQDNLIIEMSDFQLLWVQRLLQCNRARVPYDIPKRGETTNFSAPRELRTSGVQDILVG